MKRAFLFGAAVVAVAMGAGCGSSNPVFGLGGAGGSGTGSNASSSGTSGTGGNASSSSGTGGNASSSSGTGGNASSSSGTGGSNALGPGDLVITEIMNNPSTVSDNEGEWFELHNPTQKTIDLAGLVLTDAAAGTHTIASSVVIMPGGYAVLGLSNNPALNGGVTVDYQYATIKFQNDTGSLTISTAANVVIDTVSYDEASGLDPDGASRTLDPGFLSASMNDTDTHWCAAKSFINGNAGDRGTPGKPNDACP
ncbi:MAG: lamin tail domain-containing protein [Minicystis sp.]